MKGEVLILFWCGIIAIIQKKNGSVYQIELDDCGKQVWRSTMRFATVAFLPVILWAGFRPGKGYADTNAYIALYQNLPTEWWALKSYVVSIGKDSGFYYFMGICKRIFGQNHRPFLLLISTIQGASMVRFYRRYSPDFALSFFLFVVSADYLSWMMNGMRQFLAVSIIYFAVPWLIEKKYLKFVAIILIASTFHSSALIMIPITFIVQGKPWNRKTVLVILAAVFAITFTQRFTGLMSDALETTVYAANIEEMSEQAGTNPLRVAVFCAPAIIALLGRKVIEQENDPAMNISVNASVFTAGIYLISMVTSGIMVGRVPIYASLFNYITLPYEINLIVQKKHRELFTWTMIVLYLVFYYYLMHFAYHRI